MNVNLFAYVFYSIFEIISNPFAFHAKRFEQKVINVEFLGEQRAHDIVSYRRFIGFFFLLIRFSISSHSTHVDRIFAEMHISFRSNTKMNFRKRNVPIKCSTTIFPGSINGAIFSIHGRSRFPGRRVRSFELSCSHRILSLLSTSDDCDPFLQEPKGHIFQLKGKSPSDFRAGEGRE